MFGWLVTIFISYLTMWNFSSDISTTVRDPRELSLPLLQSLQRSSALPWRCLKNAQPGASLFDWNSEMMQAIDHLRKAVLKRIYRSTIVLTMFFGIGRNPAWISRRLFPPAARNASLPKWLQYGFHRLSCWDMGRSQMGGPQILVALCLLTSWNHERSMKIIHFVATPWVPNGIISSVWGKHCLPSEALEQPWNFSNADLLRCSSTESRVNCQESCPARWVMT